MKKIILLKDCDKITISMDDYHYSVTCSHVKNNKSRIYLKSREPDSNNSWGLFTAKSYINNGYKVLKGASYIC